jgi:hypothetical protein
MKIRSLADNLFRADGQTDRRDEANSYISQFFENTQTSSDSLTPPSPTTLYCSTAQLPHSTEWPIKLYTQFDMQNITL